MNLKRKVTLNKMSKQFFEKVLQEQYEELLRRKWNFEHSTSNDRVAVIVEPRRHDLLPHVCANVMWYLGHGWNLHIFTGRGGREWVESAVLEPLQHSTAKISELSEDNLRVTEYSALLMSKRFWEAIVEPHVLIFQTDCIMFRSGIDAFVDAGFDYVGANYFNPRDLAPFIGGIQGGFSLRSRSTMLEIIQSVTPHDVNAYRIRMGCSALDLPIAEDVYFTHACEMLAKRVLAVEARKYFSIEAEWFERPLAFHGFVHDYFNNDQNKTLVCN